MRKEEIIICKLRNKVHEPLQVALSSLNDTYSTFNFHSGVALHHFIGNILY